MVGKMRFAGAFLFLVLILSSVASVYAITGSIGNARMILRVDQGEKIEKHILIKNVNEVSVDVEMTITGDLADNMKLTEDKFTLSPGEDKKAFFTINVKNSGTTESKINVKFTPTDGGSGVGLSSTIIVIAAKTDSGFFDFLDGGDKESEETEEEVSFGKQNEDVVSEAQEQSKDKESNSLFAVGGGITTLVFIALLALLIYASKSKKKKREIKPKKSAKK